VALVAEAFLRSIKKDAAEIRWFKKRKPGIYPLHHHIEKFSSLRLVSCVQQTRLRMHFAFRGVSEIENSHNI
jgi:hypothetical protein